jgi:hypothetical protein
MTAPAGIVKKTKNNGNKKYRENEEWQKAKKLGRRKQLWVWDDEANKIGHWEKV